MLRALFILCLCVSALAVQYPAADEGKDKEAVAPASKAATGPKGDEEPEEPAEQSSSPPEPVNLEDADILKPDEEEASNFEGQFKQVFRKIIGTQFFLMGDGKAVEVPKPCLGLEPPKLAFLYRNLQHWKKIWDELSGPEKKGLNAQQFVKFYAAIALPDVEAQEGETDSAKASTIPNRVLKSVANGDPTRTRVTFQEALLYFCAPNGHNEELLKASQELRAPAGDDEVEVGAATELA